MDMKNYQKIAAQTDQHRADVNGEQRLTIPLLGLVGEAGTLLAEYKKRLRDRDAHQLFKPFFKEELGDILWYVSNIATILGFDLDEIARENLAKTQERWPRGKRTLRRELFDEKYPKHERLPRRFVAEFRPVNENGKKTVEVIVDGERLGDTLTDNAYGDDGYRYHDIFHLSHAAILGWSPVIRRLFKRKRKSKAKTDEVEDGARAAILEEAIAAMVYCRARSRNYFKGVKHLDFSLLKTIKDLVRDREVSACSYSDWERAILEGYKVFTLLRSNKGGRVTVDLRKKKLEFSPW